MPGVSPVSGLARSHWTLVHWPHLGGTDSPSGLGSVGSRPKRGSPQGVTMVTEVPFLSKVVLEGKCCFKKKKKSPHPRTRLEREGEREMLTGERSIDRLPPTCARTRARTRSPGVCPAVHRTALTTPAAGRKPVFSITMALLTSAAPVPARQPQETRLVSLNCSLSNERGVLAPLTRGEAAGTSWVPRIAHPGRAGL